MFAFSFRAPARVLVRARVSYYLLIIITLNNIVKLLSSLQHFLFLEFKMNKLSHATIKNILSFLTYEEICKGPARAEKGWIPSVLKWSQRSEQCAPALTHFFRRFEMENKSEDEKRDFLRACYYVNTKASFERVVEAFFGSIKAMEPALFEYRSKSSSFSCDAYIIDDDSEDYRNRKWGPQRKMIVLAQGSAQFQVSKMKAYYEYPDRLVIPYITNCVGDYYYSLSAVVKYTWTWIDAEDAVKIRKKMKKILKKQLWKEKNRLQLQPSRFAARSSDCIIL